MPIEETIKETLSPLLEQVRNDYYKPDYRASVTEAELVGVMVAKFFRWDERIISAFLYALEDANFSTLESQLEKVTGVTI